MDAMASMSEHPELLTKRSASWKKRLYHQYMEDEMHGCDAVAVISATSTATDAGQLKQSQLKTSYLLSAENAADTRKLSEEQVTQLNVNLKPIACHNAKKARKDTDSVPAMRLGCLKVLQSKSDSPACSILGQAAPVLNMLQLPEQEPRPSNCEQPSYCSDGQPTSVDPASGVQNVEHALSLSAPSSPSLNCRQWPCAHPPSSRSQTQYSPFSVPAQVTDAAVARSVPGPVRISLPSLANPTDLLEQPRLTSVRSAAASQHDEAGSVPSTAKTYAKATMPPRCSVQMPSSKPTEQLDQQLTLAVAAGLQQTRQTVHRPVPVRFCQQIQLAKHIVQPQLLSNTSAYASDPVTLLQKGRSLSGSHLAPGIAAIATCQDRCIQGISKSQVGLTDHIAHIRYTGTGTFANGAPCPSSNGGKPAAFVPNSRPKSSDGKRINSVPSAGASTGRQGRCGLSHTIPASALVAPNLSVQERLRHMLRGEPINSAWLTLDSDPDYDQVRLLYRQLSTSLDKSLMSPRDKFGIGAVLGSRKFDLQGLKHGP